MTVPTNVLFQYVMVGQLLIAPFQAVYWTVYNTPDLTGTFSGYAGQLQNIKISATYNISSPTSGVNVPTGPAGGDLDGYYPNPSIGQVSGSVGLLLVPASSVALTTGTVTLTAAQYQFPYLVFTGSLSGNVSVVLPVSVGSQWVVDATACTLNGHTITLSANSHNWGTTIGVADLYQVTYGGSGKLFGVALTP